jgi:hypothetical protein
VFRISPAISSSQKVRSHLALFATSHGHHDLGSLRLGHAASSTFSPDERHAHSIIIQKVIYKAMHEALLT